MGATITANVTVLAESLSTHCALSFGDRNSCETMAGRGNKRPTGAAPSKVPPKKLRGSQDSDGMDPLHLNQD